MTMRELTVFDVSPVQTLTSLLSFPSPTGCSVMTEQITYYLEYMKCINSIIKLFVLSGKGSNLCNSTFV